MLQEYILKFNDINKNSNIASKLDSFSLEKVAIENKILPLLKKIRVNAETISQQEKGVYEIALKKAKSGAESDRDIYNILFFMTFLLLPLPLISPYFLIAPLYILALAGIATYSKSSREKRLSEKKLHFDKAKDFLNAINRLSGRITVLLSREKIEDNVLGAKVNPPLISASYKKNHRKKENPGNFVANKNNV